MSEELFSMIGEITDISGKTPNSAMKLRADIGMSSFDLISLAVMIEEKYQITVEDSEIAGIKTVGELEQLIVKRKTA